MNILHSSPIPPLAPKISGVKEPLLVLSFLLTLLFHENCCSWFPLVSLWVDMRYSNIKKMLSLRATRSCQPSHLISRRNLLWLILGSSLHCPMAGGEAPLGRSCTLCWVERSVDFSLRHGVEPQSPPFLHDRAWLTLNGSPQAQVDGRSCSGKLYCNRRESLNSCLFNVKPWSLRGMALSQELEPLSLACCVRRNSSGFSDASMLSILDFVFSALSVRMSLFSSSTSCSSVFMISLWDLINSTCCLVKACERCHPVRCLLYAAGCEQWCLLWRDQVTVYLSFTGFDFYLPGCFRVLGVVVTWESQTLCHFWLVKKDWEGGYKARALAKQHGVFCNGWHSTAERNGESM